MYTVTDLVYPRTGWDRVMRAVDDALASGLGSVKV